MAKEKTGVYEMELSEKKVAYLSNPAVKEGLLIYLTSNSKIASARWDSARGFKQAFDNRDKETVINEDGKPVPRWDTKSKFYKFVGITDANGSQLFNAVDFDDNNTVDGRKLSEVGFTVGKVYALSSMLEDGEFLEFLEYGAKVVASDRIEDIARLSDKGLINLIKSFHASKEQEQEQEQETIDYDVYIKSVVDTLNDVHDGAVYDGIIDLLAYVYGKHDNGKSSAKAKKGISTFIEYLKSRYGIK